MLQRWATTVPAFLVVSDQSISKTDRRFQKSLLLPLLSLRMLRWSWCVFNLGVFIILQRLNDTSSSSACLECIGCGLCAEGLSEMWALARRTEYFLHPFYLFHLYQTDSWTHPPTLYLPNKRITLYTNVIQWNSLKTYHYTIAAQSNLTNCKCIKKKSNSIEFLHSKNKSSSLIQ